MNNKGEMIIEAQFGEATIFSEDLALVNIGDQFNTIYGFIDRNGKWVIRPIYSYTLPFNEGVAMVEIKGEKDKRAEGRIERRFNGKCGYITKTGQFFIEPKYNDAGSFGEGLAPVRKGGLYGYIDKNEKMIIDPQFIKAGTFSKGLAPVAIARDFSGSHKLCYINKSGKIIINASKKDIWVNEISSFSEGLAAIHVKVDNSLQPFKWGYMDKQGNWIIKPQFEEASSFKNNIARVKYYGLFGFIDRTGNWIIGPEYSEATDFIDNVAAVLTQKDGLY